MKTRKRAFFRLRHAVMLLALVGILLPCCTTTNIIAGGDAISAQNICTDCHKTTWAYAWGLVQPSPVKPDCPHTRVSEVRVSTNLGYALITTLTLGIVIPQDVAWDCAAQDVPTGEFGQP